MRRSARRLVCRSHFLVAIAMTVSVVAVQSRIPRAEAAPEPVPSGIAFVSMNYVGTGPAIHVLGPGGRSRVVADATYGAYDPAWSPDGRRIAYVHAVSATESRLVIMDPSNGVAPVSFEYPDIAIVRRPAWSPDGHRIVFAGTARFSRQMRIYVISLANPRNPMTVASSGHNDSPKWSPDGTKLAFIRGRSTVGFPAYAEPNSFTVGAVVVADWHEDGGRGLRFRLRNEREVTIATVTAYDWAPDGRRFAFSAPYSSVDARIYESEIDGTTGPPLTSGPAFAPAHTSDGGSIVYARGSCYSCGGGLFSSPGDGQVTARAALSPSVHGSFALEGEAGIPVEDMGVPPHENHRYVAIGDSVTTGHSVVSCKSPDEKWFDGCQPEDGGRNPFPPAGTPYPQLVADRRGITDIARVGIWGYDVRRAASVYPNPGRIPLRERPGGELAERDAMFTAVDGAHELVTGALGVNDARFSDFGLLAAHLVLYDISGDPYTAIFDHTLALLEEQNAHDFLTLATVLAAAARRGVNVVVPLYYVPFEGSEKKCERLNTISRGIVDAVNFMIFVSLSRYVNPDVDPRIELVRLGDVFAGHGAAGDLKPDPGSWVFARTCSAAELARLVPKSILQKFWNPDEPSDLEIAADPHPNPTGSQVIAETVAIAASTMPPPVSPDDRDEDEGGGVS